MIYKVLDQYEFCYYSNEDIEECNEFCSRYGVFWRTQGKLLRVQEHS